MYINRGRINQVIRIFGVVFLYFTMNGFNFGQDPGPLNSLTPAGMRVNNSPFAGFDSVNPYNRVFNYTMPLLNLKGRGEVGYEITLRTKQEWPIVMHFEIISQSYEYSIGGPVLESFDYSPGKMFIRTSGDNPQEPQEGCYEYYEKSITYFSFVLPNGSEKKFFDDQSKGQLVTVHCGVTAPYRGNLFYSTDGDGSVFISDTNIQDSNFYPQNISNYAHGFLKFSNGVIYRIEKGAVVWMKDKNGNRMDFTYRMFYGYPQEIQKVTDNLGREVEFTYNTHLNGEKDYDEITYKGFDSNQRSIKVYYDSLSNQLASGETLQTYGTVFGIGYPFVSTNSLIEASIVSRVELPDAQYYDFKYNSLAELARIETPNGAAMEYSYIGGLLDLPTRVLTYTVNRTLSEKRLYADGVNLTNRTTYEKLAGVNQVIEEVRDNNNNLLSKVKHYYMGLSSEISIQNINHFHAHWQDGVEYQTEIFDSDGSTVLRRKNLNYTPRFNRSWGGESPDLTSIVETLEPGGQNLVKALSFSYDQYGNVTDEYKFDYGVGTFGSFLYRKHSTYITNASYTSYSGPNLRNLLAETWVSSDGGDVNKKSLMQFEYDNYIPDSNHAALIPRSSVIGHDVTNYGTGFPYRGNVTKVTSYADAQNQTGAVNVYSQYDILGNVVKTIDSNGNATTINYNDNFGSPDGEATSNTAPTELGGLNTFAFPTSATNPLNWTGYIQYDYFTGQPVNSQDINGIIAKTNYNDPLDRPTQTVTAVGTVHESQSNIIYDEANRRVESKSDLFILNDNKLKSEKLYDALGRTIESRSYKYDDYTVVKTEYDSLGRVKRTTNPFRPHLSEPELWTENFYDALGRIIKVKTPDTAEMLMNYSGNTVTVTDQAGKQRRSISNAVGHLIRVDEPNDAGQLGTIASPNQPTNYSYDVLGNLLTVMQAGTNEQCGPTGGSCSQTRTFTYNNLSRLLSATNPESGAISYEYDNNGNLTEKTDIRGVQTEYIYDALNRVTNRNYSLTGSTPPNYQATPDVEYTYKTTAPGLGSLIKVESSVSTTEYTGFDILGRVTGHKQTTDGEEYSTGYVYNLSGALIEQTYPSGRVVKNVIDGNGDLSIVQSRKNASHGYWNYANSFTYNAAGAVTSMQLGNGRWESTQFNSRLQPTQIALGATNGATNLLKLDYSYGTTANNGNVMSQTITVPTVGIHTGFTAVQNYTYDSLNRLESATENIDADPTPSWKQAFTYDRYGNRNFDEANTTFTGFDKLCNSNSELCADLKKIFNPSINPNNNQLNTSEDYIFDAAGNTIEDPQGKTFIYDAENKQVEVKDHLDNTIGEYFYDGEGKRVKKVVPSTGEVTIFTYNAVGQLMAEYSSIVAEREDAEVSYLTIDHLGSPRINTDQNGAVNSRHDYHPFGEQIYVAQRTQYLGYIEDTIRKKFTGFVYDNEIDLNFAQARFHNSGVGRFTSPDPLTSSMTVFDPQSFNRYSYVGNNPTNYTDPSGLCKVNGSPDDGKPCPNYSGVVYQNAEGGFTNFKCDSCTLFTGDPVQMLIGATSVLVTSAGWSQIGPGASQVAVEVGYGVLEDSIITIGETAVSNTINTRPLITIANAIGAVGFILFSPTSISCGASPGMASDGNGGCIYDSSTDPAYDIQDDIQPTTATEDRPSHEPVFVRNGAIPQRLADLTSQAEAAEKAGYGYGISVSLEPAATSPNTRIAPFSNANSAFQIDHTPTRNNPNHHTVIFPKPLTQDVVNKFYFVFRRP